ncbi:MAG: class I SAM-dependent DNA methyltransferase [Phycisphaerales bacterium]|nr:class I SAM-dependent DNA methyltransferase [Phycisphaerales bacterium]
MAIQQLLGLEKDVITYAARGEIGVGLLPRVRPTQLHGIEINPYAAELAQVVIWIGYLQWMRDNGFNVPRDPILEPITSIENRDAILAWVDEAGQAIPTWREGAACTGVAQWPEADFIVGNPPFLGSRKARQELSDPYVDAYQHAFASLPEGVDLCCYWFELARRCVKGSATRVGLLATQAIRGGSSRTALQRVQDGAVIVEAHSDRQWMLDGAAVQISIVIFTRAPLDDEKCRLDDREVQGINADLTAGVDLTATLPLPENKDLSFQGTINSGKFDTTWVEAREMLATPNPTPQSNRDVLRPWSNGRDVTARSRGQWIIDFGVERSASDAAVYEEPYRRVTELVRPQRDVLRQGAPGYAHSSKYPTWQLWNTRHEMRKRLQPLKRFIVTPRVSKHRLFSWLRFEALADAQLIVFARPDDYLLGLLHSSIHEMWARRKGTQLREAESGFRYTPTTCFETFPLPWPPGSEPTHDIRYEAIAEAARVLDEQRERWLNPPEWVEEIAAAVDAEDDFADVARVSGEEARRLIRQSAIDARAAKDARLKKRTLTNLYNQRPTWLRLAHRRLDEAVLAAYAHTDPAGGWDVAWAEVFEETGAGQPLPEGHSLTDRRAEVEQFILAALLRLNLERAQALS